jgi:hypothetical protein
MKSNLSEPRRPRSPTGTGSFLLFALFLGALTAPPAPPPLPRPALSAEATRACLVAPDEPRAAGIGKYFSGLATRSRVVQICVVAMCLALLILMKK